MKKLMIFIFLVLSLQAQTFECTLFDIEYKDNTTKQLYHHNIKAYFKTSKNTLRFTTAVQSDKATLLQRTRNVDNESVEVYIGKIAAYAIYNNFVEGARVIYHDDHSVLDAVNCNEVK